jgi:DNA anti-recombination protein RmuC
LGKEAEYNRSNVVSMAQMVKAVDEGLSKRAQRAFDESMEAVRVGQQRLDGL